jgi:hypothetical protein
MNLHICRRIFNHVLACSLPNALPCFQTTFNTRTSGHCLGTLKTVHFLFPSVIIIYVTRICSATWRYRSDTNVFPQHIQIHMSWGMTQFWNFFIIWPTRCTNFTNLFCHETVRVSDSSAVHHQEFIHCTLSNDICHTGLYSVQWINSWWWTEELSETCRVSCQNKFVKLVHLVGHIIKTFVTMHGHTNVKNNFANLRWTVSILEPARPLIKAQLSSSFASGFMNT